MHVVSLHIEPVLSFDEQSFTFTTQIMYIIIVILVLFPGPQYASIYSVDQISSIWVASFPGRKRNGLATSASSNCMQMLRHGNCNISLHNY